MPWLWLVQRNVDPFPVCRPASHHLARSQEICMPGYRQTEEYCETTCGRATSVSARREKSPTSLNKVLRRNMVDR